MQILYAGGNLAKIDLQGIVLDREDKLDEILFNIEVYSVFIIKPTAPEYPSLLSDLLKPLNDLFASLDEPTLIALANFYTTVKRRLIEYARSKEEDSYKVEFTHREELIKEIATLSQIFQRFVISTDFVDKLRTFVDTYYNLRNDKVYDLVTFSFVSKLLCPIFGEINSVMKIKYINITNKDLMCVEMLAPFLLGSPLATSAESLFEYISDIVSDNSPKKNWRTFTNKMYAILFVRRLATLDSSKSEREILEYIRVLVIRQVQNWLTSSLSKVS